MGKIKIKGMASKECNYDLMVITLAFEVKDQSTAAAVKGTTEKCELFLDMLKKEQLFGHSARYIEDSLDQRERYGSDDEIDGTDIVARRTIAIRYAFDMARINRLMEIIQTSGIAVEFEIKYLLSRSEDLKASLIQEAVQASRKRAEIIAEAAGSKIVGIDGIEIDENDRYWIDEYDDDECFYCEEGQWKFLNRNRGPIYGASHRHSDDLSGPVTTRSITADVIWNIE